MRRARFHRLALRELFDAAKRWDRERPGSGSRLLTAVEQTTDRVSAAAEQGSPYLHDTRRFIVHRFPFSTVYVSRVPTNHVIAIAHHRRKPGYWRRRLKDA
jgi:toxin ParE1/3/4